jgi:hypothetical protein
LIVKKAWRALLAFLVMSVFLLTAPLPLLGSGMILKYGAALGEASRWTSSFGYLPSGNYSISGAVRLLLGGTSATVVSTVLVGLAVLTLAAYAWRTSFVDCAWGLAAVVGVLASPHVLLHDLSILLLPVAIALRYRPWASSSLFVLLAAGDAAVVAGLFVVQYAPAQLAVLATLGLGVWLLMRCSTQVPVVKLADRPAAS